MKGMTLVKKSTCAFAVLILFFVSFGIYAVYSGTKISQSANIIKEWSDNFGTVSQLSDSLNGMRLKASMLFITRTLPSRRSSSVSSRRHRPTSKRASTRPRTGEIRMSSAIRKARKKSWRP